MEIYNQGYNGQRKETIINRTVKSGLSFGSCLAMIVSYTAWGSIPWAIFHGLLSWVYVVYYIIVH